MTNPVVETDLATVLNQINGKLDAIASDVVELKIGQSRLEGKIDAVEARLDGKIETLDGKFEQLDKRMSSVEFANRGIFVGIILLVFGGAVKLLGIIP